jgi:hypothetical protein
MGRDLQRPLEGYEHIASAGIWEMLPVDPGDLESKNDTEAQDSADIFGRFIGMLANMPPYPYLRLLQNDDLPTKDEPTYVFQAALTRVPEEPFIPVGDTDDDLAYWAELYLVTVDDREEMTPPAMIYDPAAQDGLQARTEIWTIDTLLPKTVKPIGFYAPLIEALGRFMKSHGSVWTPDSLDEIAEIGSDFYTFTTRVPEESIDLHLGGETYAVTASALIAAGLRLAVCETIRLSRYRPLITAVQENPELLKELIAREEQRVTEIAAPAGLLQLPPATEDFPR